MCCKTPDYSEWLKAMIKEINELEQMCHWKVAKLSSVPYSAKLMSCRMIMRLKYRNGPDRTVGASSCTPSCTPRYRLPTRKRTRLLWKIFSHLLPFYYLACPSAHISYLGFLWILTPCVFLFSSELAESERLDMKGPPSYNIGDGNCLSMLKYIHGLVQASRQ